MLKFKVTKDSEQIMSSMDITTQNPELALNLFLNSEEETYLWSKILKIVLGQKPGVQQSHKRIKQGKDI